MQAWQNLGSTAPERLIELARAAEDVGMHGVTLPEHLVTPTTIVTPNPYVAGGGAGYPPDTPFIDPFVAFGALSAITTTLQFMANVYVLPLRHLFVAAKAISSAAVLSNNRLVLGVGIGWLREEFEATSMRFGDRGARADVGRTDRGRLDPPSISRGPTRAGADATGSDPRRRRVRCRASTRRARRRLDRRQLCRTDVDADTSAPSSTARTRRDTRPSVCRDRVTPS